MRTRYDVKNGKFSDRAHLAAQSQIYPKLFNVDKSKLVFETVTMQGSNDIRNRILDGEMAVDRIVKVSYTMFRRPISFTVQERFRRSSFRKFQDVTITEFNTASGQPSELYKLSGGLFVYGYYNEVYGVFEQFVCFNSSTLLFYLGRGLLESCKMKMNEKGQTFIPVKFKVLRESGLMLYEYAIDDPVYGGLNELEIKNLETKLTPIQEEAYYNAIVNADYKSFDIAQKAFLFKCTC